MRVAAPTAGLTSRPSTTTGASTTSSSARTARPCISSPSLSSRRPISYRSSQSGSRLNWHEVARPLLAREEQPMSARTLRLWRGDAESGRLVDYEVEAETGMVVLDAVLEIQRSQAKDLAVRWNCKAAKCGSCSAEVNGRPRLMCKTRLDHLPAEVPITVEPLKAFPLIRDLVTDVSWNYKVNKMIPAFQPRPGVEWKMYQRDIDRVQEFRKCIECF